MHIGNRLNLGNRREVLGRSTATVLGADQTNAMASIRDSSVILMVINLLTEKVHIFQLAAAVLVISLLPGAVHLKEYAQ